MKKPKPIEMTKDCLFATREVLSKHNKASNENSVITFDTISDVVAEFGSNRNGSDISGSICGESSIRYQLLNDAARICGQPRLQLWVRILPEASSVLKQ